MFLDFLLPKDPSVKRHALKAITWRIVGTVDTVIIAWIITGKPIVGIQIGGIEVLTKMVLYFVHERVWFKINFGLPHRNKEKSNLNADKKNE